MREQPDFVRVVSQGHRELIAKWLDQRIAVLRAANDRPRSETGTATLRGKIAEAKAMAAVLRGGEPPSADQIDRPLTD